MIIIKNGALVTPQGLRRADLAMDGDKIVRIAAAIEPAEGDTVEDAAGCWVFPGFIDGHTRTCSAGLAWIGRPIALRPVRVRLPAAARRPLWTTRRPIAA